MTNTEIANRFTRIADILEIQGENPFKIRAYRTASETILDLDEPLSALNDRGVLPDIPGFGEAIVAKTKDFLATGTTALYERIKDSVPDGVVRMARVPGLTPKTVKTLWESLGVASIEELEAAAKAEKVRVLPNFGAAKEQKLLDNIERWRRLSETTPLYVAVPIAEHLATVIRGFMEVRRVEISGEIRRGCETVQNIYLLVDSERVASTIAQVKVMPGLTSIVTAAATYVIADTEWEIRLTVAVYDAGLQDASFGFAQLAATGPASFYDALDPGERTMTGPFPDEEAVFAALGLPYIPPELRDAPDITKLVWHGDTTALNVQLAALVRESDFRGQLHEHSTYSDGGATIRQMAEAALARGYEYLAITDHSRSLTIANGLSRERLEAEIEEIAALNREFVPRGLTLLSGIEADILADGSIDCEDDLLARLDIVVASVHRRYKENAAEMTARMVRAMEHPSVDIIGHPTGRLLGRRESYPVEIDAVIAAAARMGTVLEINASPERLDLSDSYAKAAKEAGAKITINSDAHSTGGLGLVSWGITVARRAWLSPDDVINTYPLDKLRATLKRNRAATT